MAFETQSSFLFIFCQDVDSSFQSLLAKSWFVVGWKFLIPGFEFNEPETKYTEKLAIPLLRENRGKK